MNLFNLLRPKLRLFNEPPALTIRQGFKGANALHSVLAHETSKRLADAARERNKLRDKLTLIQTRHEQETVMLHFRETGNLENPRECIVFKEDGHEEIPSLVEEQEKDGMELTGTVKFRRGVLGNPSPLRGRPYNLE